MAGREHIRAARGAYAMVRELGWQAPGLVGARPVCGFPARLATPGLRGGLRGAGSSGERISGLAASDRQQALDVSPAAGSIAHVERYHISMPGSDNIRVPARRPALPARHATGVIRGARMVAAGKKQTFPHCGRGWGEGSAGADPRPTPPPKPPPTRGGGVSFSLRIRLVLMHMGVPGTPRHPAPSRRRNQNGGASHGWPRACHLDGPRSPFRAGRHPRPPAMAGKVPPATAPTTLPATAGARCRTDRRAPRRAG